jgi:uncharacterized protein YbjT (DUF2867 family)
LLKSKYKNRFASHLNNTKIMKYIITGSLGHISRPVVQQLLAAGHGVTVITSGNSRTAEIEALGAVAAVGSVEDPAFIAKTFKGADSVYLMIPPAFGTQDWPAYQRRVADNFVAAIRANGIRHAVVLSSIGAHMRKGAGPVDGLAYLETALESVDNISAVFLRPSYFFYNLFQQADLIRHAGIVGSAQPADHRLVLTHTSDIADVVAEELLNTNATGKRVRYIASDERTWQEITAVLSAAAGKKNIPYVEFTDDQSREGMLRAGLSATIADGYTAMGQALRSKEMEAHYRANKPASLGKMKLEDFAKEFAAAYNAG